MTILIIAIIAFIAGVSLSCYFLGRTVRWNKELIRLLTMQRETGHIMREGLRAKLVNQAEEIGRLQRKVEDLRAINTVITDDRRR